MNLQYTGIGTRVLNFCIDIPFVFILAYVGFKFHQWYVYYYHVQYFKFGWFFALAVFIFYTLFEGFWNKTPGKWFTQTKVVNQQGLKPSFTSIIIRSLSRIIIIDPFFIPFLNKPLHDYLSKTDLIQE